MATAKFIFTRRLERTARLAAAMPGYRHPDELAALLSPAVRERIAALGIGLVTYGDLAA